MKLPLWIYNPPENIPGYVVSACREAGEEVLNMENLPEDLRQDVAGTRCVLLRWSWFYYNGTQEVEDKNFDALYKRLCVQEIQYPELITPLSPTQRVGKIMPKQLI